jgi:hypothetical protein
VVAELVLAERPGEEATAVFPPFEVDDESSAQLRLGEDHPIAPFMRLLRE